ncbi:hypothetical protein EPUL_005716 [Erysiphe pulchra]|uniref:Uncharacterized protein n=1 Tax=Erysiphe pulchra TaxID=225359 RepID=A0A2S4PKT9_9PEZI|nr:hypothetical protein EPUL_005716 [Erysiphe pulchra]
MEDDVVMYSDISSIPVTPLRSSRDPIHVIQYGPQASLTQTTDAAYDAASKAVQAKHTVLSTIPRKVGLENSINNLSYAAIARKPKVVLSSRFARSQPRALINQRPRASDNVTDNRIFVSLPEGHVSRNHHIHTVKAALTEKLGLSGRPLKGVKYVKSRLALLPADADQAAKILEKAPEITAVLGGTVEKAEKWFNYVLDFVPLMIKCIDESTVKVTPEMALEDIKFEIVSHQNE